MDRDSMKQVNLLPSTWIVCRLLTDGEYGGHELFLTISHQFDSAVDWIKEEYVVDEQYVVVKADKPSYYWTGAPYARGLVRDYYVRTGEYTFVLHGVQGFYYDINEEEYQ